MSDPFSIFMTSRDPERVQRERYPALIKVLAECAPDGITPVVDTASEGELRRRVNDLEARLRRKARGAVRVVATGEVVAAYRRKDAEARLLKLKLEESRALLEVAARGGSIGRVAA